MTRKVVLYLTAIVTLLAFLTHPLISEEVEIHLSQGWNLVSLPVEPDSGTIPYIPPSVIQQCRAIWTYNAFSGTWEYYIAGANLITLTTIKPFRGYWIDMSAGATFTITGAELCNRAVHLWQGWNLVGYGCSTGRLIEENSFPATGIGHSIWA